MINYKNTILTLVLAAIFAGCTNLDETLYDKVKSSDYGKTSGEIETRVSRRATVHSFQDGGVQAPPGCGSTIRRHPDEPRNAQVVGCG